MVFDAVCLTAAEMTEFREQYWRERRAQIVH